MESAFAEGQARDPAHRVDAEEAEEAHTMVAVWPAISSRMPRGCIPCIQRNTG